MLRRASSDRLDRRRSTSSAHSRSESIDPQIGRQYAHTAAILAFTRAQERHSIEMDNKGTGFQPSNITSSHREPQNSAQTGHVAANPLKRQQSVRFTGPNAVPTRQNTVPRPLHTLPGFPQPNPATLRPMAMTTNDPVPAAYRPPSRSSSIGKASAGKAPARYMSAAAAYSEYYTQEDDIASTPSSYRRVRRSKSMFSPLKAPSVFYTNGTPERPVSRFRVGEQTIAASRTPPNDLPTAALRGPKSMSFLRGGYDHVTSVLQERNDEAVQLARDRFFHQTTQQRLREQPSFLFRSKSQRQEKRFGQTLRTSSSNTYGTPVAFASQVEPPKESKLKEKARRVSKSLKDKFKRAFGKSKDEPVEVPNQQVEAPETHVRRYPGAVDIENDGFENIPQPHPTTLHRVASRPSMNHPESVNQELKSHAGSVKSFHTDRSDDTSRVTSWNSTGVNTIASQGARLQSERDLQRLSVINEDGTHIPSTSFNHQKVSNQFSAYPIIHRPSKSLGHNYQPAPLSLPSPPIMSAEGAKVYAALKQLQDHSPEASPEEKFEAMRMATSENVRPPPLSVEGAKRFAAAMRELDDLSPRTKLEAIRLEEAKLEAARLASLEMVKGSRTPATIRQVPKSNPSSAGKDSADHQHQWVNADGVHSARAENVFGSTGTHIHQWVTADPLREARMRDQDDVFSPKSKPFGHIPNTKENTPAHRNRAGRDSAVTPDASITASYHIVPEKKRLSPQEIANILEPIIRDEKRIRQTKSTFFGGSSHHISRAQSPFRRALTEADYNPNIRNGSSHLSLSDFPIPNPLNIQSKNITATNGNHNEAVEPEIAYSESVYSRTTSGQIIGPTQSSLTLPLPEGEIAEMHAQNANTGDVVILDRTTYRPAMPNGANHRATNSAGSTDWKKWMSIEVAKLERAKGSYVNYALPTMPKSFHAGHVRESAQISGDETDIAQAKVVAVKQPLGIIQQNATPQNMQQNPQNPPVLKPILKNRSTISLVENAEHSNILPVIPIPPPPPPPMPSRSPLRPVQSKSSLRSITTMNTVHTVKTQSAPNSAAKPTSMNRRNVLHKRNTSQNTMCSTKSLDTPAKLVKRTIRKVSNTTQAPSPGDGLSNTTGSQVQTLSIRSKKPVAFWNANTENQIPQQGEDIYNIEGAGLMGPNMNGGLQELDAQQMGSKRMVDMFLSSRRRRMASDGDSDRANPGNAFI